jgi:hypothetical protein
MTTTPLAPAGTATAQGPGVPTSVMETWEMRVDGTIYLNVLKATRFGQVIESQMKVGPRRKGHRFEISTDDRRDNQRNIVTAEQDPFRNGMLTRVDANQQAEPETQSEAVLTPEEELAILDLPEDEFRAKVAGLPEVPVRNIRSVAEAAGASHSKVTWLDDHIRERFQPGGPQESLTSDTKSERLS